MAFDVQGALNAGYTQAEIDQYLANESKSSSAPDESPKVQSGGFDVQGALDAGYTQAEIDAFMAQEKPPLAKSESNEAKTIIEAISGPAAKIPTGINLKDTKTVLMPMANAIKDYGKNSGIGTAAVDLGAMLGLGVPPPFAAYNAAKGVVGMAKAIPEVVSRADLLSERFTPEMTQAWETKIVPDIQDAMKKYPKYRQDILNAFSSNNVQSMRAAISGLPDEVKNTPEMKSVLKEISKFNTENSALKQAGRILAPVAKSLVKGAGILGTGLGVLDTGKNIANEKYGEAAVSGGTTLAGLLAPASKLIKLGFPASLALHSGELNSNEDEELKKLRGY